MNDYILNNSLKGDLTSSFSDWPLEQACEIPWEHFLAHMPRAEQLLSVVKSV